MVVPSPIAKTARGATLLRERDGKPPNQIFVIDSYKIDDEQI
jgi:hypothetical protein